MKIAILNECFFTPNQIKQLEAIGQLQIYTDTTTEKQAKERLQDVSIAVVDGFISPLTKNVLENTNKLQLICLMSTGFDSIVDYDTANKKDIKVANVPEFATDAVAEYAIGLMFAVMRKIPQEDKLMRIKPFELDPGDKTQRKFLGNVMRGKTIGIIGLGNIGLRVAEIAHGLGMHVLGFNRTQKNVSFVKQVGLEQLLKESDVISLHLALSKETEHILSAREFQLMKPGSIVINTARGKHIDTQSLIDSLQSGKLAGAGLDVLEDWSIENPLLKLDTVVLTPHSAFFTKESLHNLASIIVKNIEAFANGKPINIVNNQYES